MLKKIFLFNLIFLICIGVKAGQKDSLVNRKLLAMSINDLMDIKVVTASKYEQSIKDAPSSITVITANDIETYGYQTLSEILNSIRGYYITNDRNYEYAGVRGFGEPTNYNKRYLILIDGHTMNENFYGQGWIGNDLGLNPEDIERVEVVRGPGSALYGTGAMLCVINIITKKTKGFKISNQIGSYGKYVEKAYWGEELKNGLKLNVSGIWGDVKGQNLYLDKYKDSANGGIAKNLDWEKYYGLYAKAEYKNLSVYAFLDSRKKAVPTASFGTVFNNPDYTTLDERQYIDARYDKDLDSNKKVFIRGYLDRYHYAADYPYSSGDQFETNFEGWYGAEGRFQWNLTSKNTFIAGGEYQNIFKDNYKQWDNSNTFYNKDFPFSTISVYLQDEYKILNNLTVIAGGRYIKHSEIGEKLLPRFSVIYSPFKTGTIKLMYGDAFRAPNIYERSYESVGDLQIANLNLKPENVKSYELNYEQEIGEMLIAKVSVFKNYFYDLIQSSNVHLQVPIYDPFQNINVYDVSQFTNSGKITAEGVDISLHAKFKSGLGAYANFSLQNARDSKSDSAISNSPQQITKAGINMKVLRYFYVAAEIYNETYRITVNNTKTSGFMIANMNISTVQIYEHLKLSFKVYNLFNKHYDNPGGLELLQPSVVTQNGRNYLLNISYEF